LRALKRIRILRTGLTTLHHRIYRRQMRMKGAVLDTGYAAGEYTRLVSPHGGNT
jgi:hypothetical protein